MPTVMQKYHKYNPAKLQFPVRATEKLNGVPGDFYKTYGWPVVLSRTREDKPILSCEHLIDLISPCISPGEHLIGELYIEGEPFSKISGLVRRQKEQCPALKLRVFDYYHEKYMEQEFVERFFRMHNIIEDIGDSRVSFVPFLFTAHKQEQLDEILATEIPRLKKLGKEGLVIQTINGVYKPGKRSWEIQKIKILDTIDAPIHSLVEAVDKTGKPKGMVGRINILLDGEVLAIGPGKLTHAERTDMWKNSNKYIGRYVEAEAMPDDDYDKLREPVFIQWRPDKDEE